MKFLTLEKFSKCWKFWLFVDFSIFLDFLWSWWIIWSILMIEKVLFWKKSWPKVKVWLFLRRWNFIRGFRNWLMNPVNFCDVLNQEIRSRCCIEAIKIKLQANRSFIDQKINDSLSSIKTLIGRFLIDYEKKLGIWRSTVDGWLR